MTKTSYENFMTKILNCGYGDLDLLDDVYSPLAEECCDIDDVIDMIQESTELSLNNLLYEVYSYIKTELCQKAREIIENETLFNEFLEDRGIEKINNFFVSDKIEEIENSYPYANCQDTHFDNILDQTVDFNKSV